MLKLARENRAWGYTRMQAALANLQYEEGRGTIARVPNGGMVKSGVKWLL